MQIATEWFAEALVTIGKGLGFARQEVTSAFIPGDQSLCGHSPPTCGFGKRRAASRSFPRRLTGLGPSASFADLAGQ